MEEVTVIIVGAGPAGLATSACLNVSSISNIVLEREDCCASLWKKRAYDRLKLHLGKQFCALPHMPFPMDAPTFLPRFEFVSYLDQYTSYFRISPRCHRSVESAYFDKVDRRWRVMAKNVISNEYEVYAAQFLVVASGENSEGVIPPVPGLDSFEGEFIHSNKYENGKRFSGKNVLVVGCGNSGMEIAYDLSNWGAKTSIVARSPVHVVTKEIVLLAMRLLQYLPVKLVDIIIEILSQMKFGNLSSYGLKRPKEGVFYNKAKTGRSATIDVGAVPRIKTGEIQVFPAIKNIEGNKIMFVDGKIDRFEAIIFATGYRSTVRHWLKDADDLFNQDGMPARSFPNHWKAKNGLYSAGFARRALEGISVDAQNIAKDISATLNKNKKGC